MDAHTKHLLSRNVTVYYILMAFAAAATFFNEILLVYYQHFSLTYTQISITVLASMMIAIVLEVPTGAFADLYGRKRSTIVAVLLLVLAIWLLVIASSFLTFLIVALLWGAAMAFMSGALDAIVYDSLKRLGRERDYIKVQGKGIGFTIAIGMLSAFFGPLAYTINIRLPFVISAVSAIGLVLVPWFIFEPSIKHTHGHVLRRHYLQIRGGFAIMWRNNRLLWLLGFTVLFGIAGSIVGQLTMAPYILSRGFSIREIGYVALISTAIQTAIMFLSHSVESRLKERRSLILVSVVSVAVLVAFVAITTKSYLIGVCFGLFYGITGFNQIIIGAYINTHLTKKNRATALSVVSMVGMLASLPFLVAMGALYDATNLTTGMTVLLGFLVVGLAALYLLRRHRQRSSAET